MNKKDVKNLMRFDFEKVTYFVANINIIALFILHLSNSKSKNFD